MDPIRVLLVDDEAPFLDVMQKRLTRRGAECATASDGPGALDMVRNNSFDVVILDVKMPGMDGIETLQKIRAMDDKIQVIMLTGHADLEAAVNGMELGAFDYLMKPVPFDDLFVKIQDAYQLNRLSQGE